MASSKKAISFRLSEQAIDLIRRLAAKLGISQVAVLEMAVRKFNGTEK